MFTKSPILLALIGWVVYLFITRRSDEKVEQGYSSGDGFVVAPPPKTDTKNEDGTTTVYTTISKAKAETIAEQLYEELYSSLITSDSKILQILKGLNEADYILVDKAFGTKGSGVFGLGEDLTVTQWIIKDTTSSTHKALKKQFPNIF